MALEATRTRETVLACISHFLRRTTLAAHYGRVCQAAKHACCMWSLANSRAHSYQQCINICIPCQERGRTAVVDNEDFGGGHAHGQVADLVGVAVAEARVKGLPLRGEQRPDVLQAPVRSNAWDTYGFTVSRFSACCLHEGCQFDGNSAGVCSSGTRVGFRSAMDRALCHLFIHSITAGAPAEAKHPL